MRAHALGKERGKAALEKVQSAMFPAKKPREAPHQAAQTLRALEQDDAVVVSKVSVVIEAMLTKTCTVDLVSTLREVARVHGQVRVNVAEVSAICSSAAQHEHRGCRPAEARRFADDKRGIIVYDRLYNVSHANSESVTVSEDGARHAAWCHLCCSGGVLVRAKCLHFVFSKCVVNFFFTFPRPFPERSGKVRLSVMHDVVFWRGGDG